MTVRPEGEQRSCFARLLLSAAPLEVYTAARTMRLSRISVVALPALASWALWSCEDSGSSSPAGLGLDSGTLDVGTTPSNEAGGAVDASTDPVLDAATTDASDASLLTSIDAGPDCHPVTSQETVSVTAAGFPADGLALWLRADRGIYGATVDGGGSEVCAWQDLSGGPTVLTNSAPPARPGFASSAIAAQPAVQFSAAPQVMTTAGVLGIGGTSARTIIAVQRLTGADGRFNPLLQGQGGTAGTYIGIDPNTWQTQGNLEGVYVTNNSYDTTTTTTTSAARIHVLTITSMANGTSQQGAIDYRIDGQPQTLWKRAGSGKFEDFSGANFTAVGVFGTPSRGGTSAGGLVAEVLVYGRALTLVERQAAEAALKARYAIP